MAEWQLRANAQSVIQICSKLAVKLQRLTKENVAKVKNRAGFYVLYNKKKKKEYCGVSTVLKHRLQSYYQKDDF